MIRLFLTLCLLSPSFAVAEEARIETIAGTGKPELGLSSGAALDVNIGQPFGVEIGPDGALFICEVQNHRVLRLDLETRRVDTVAGNGRRGYSGDGGPATAAALNEPYEVRFDSKGDMYFVEMMNAVVRKLDRATGIASTVAGSGKAGFGGDEGPAAKAELRQPHSIALDSKSGLYIADIGNHRIRRVDLGTGLIETIAGNGETGLPESESVARGKPLWGPRALAIEGDTLWVALREGHSVWRLDLASHRIRRVAGTGAAGFSDGPAADASFNGPKGIAVLEKQRLYVLDTENNALRSVELDSRSVRTVAGLGPKSAGFSGDGGPAIRGAMDRPHGVAVGPGGVIYVGDTNNHRVRRIVPAPDSGSK